MAKIAEKNKVNLEFEAAVAGGIPILRSIKEGVATNKISKVFGILNGTCNYILSEMENLNQNFENVQNQKQINLFQSGEHATAILSRALAAAPFPRSPPRPRCLRRRRRFHFRFQNSTF